VAQVVTSHHSDASGRPGHSAVVMSGVSEYPLPEKPTVLQTAPLCRPQIRQL
jgi:hypothetical protein